MPLLPGQPNGVPVPCEGNTISNVSSTSSSVSVMPNVSRFQSLWASFSKFTRSSRELAIKLTCTKRTLLSQLGIFVGPDNT